MSNWLVIFSKIFLFWKEWSFFNQYIYIYIFRPVHIDKGSWYELHLWLFQPLLAFSKFGCHGVWGIATITSGIISVLLRLTKAIRSPLWRKKIKWNKGLCGFGERTKPACSNICMDSALWKNSVITTNRYRSGTPGTTFESKTTWKIFIYFFWIIISSYTCFFLFIYFYLLLLLLFYYYCY